MYLYESIAALDAKVRRCKFLCEDIETLAETRVRLLASATRRLTKTKSPSPIPFAWVDFEKMYGATEELKSFVVE